MAKSFTKNAKHSADSVENIAVLAHKYVQHWTRTEAQQMVKEELVILPTKWGFQVGRHSIKRAGTDWQLYNVFGEVVETFTCKQSAVTYSVLDQTNRINMAATLRGQDSLLGKLMNDQSAYVTRRNRSIKANDFDRTGIIEARLNETTSLIELAKENLEKTLNKAKYLKGIWE